MNESQKQAILKLQQCIDECTDLQIFDVMGCYESPDTINRFCDAVENTIEGEVTN